MYPFVGEQGKLARPKVSVKRFWTRLWRSGYNADSVVARKRPPCQGGPERVIKDRNETNKEA